MPTPSSVLKKESGKRKTAGASRHSTTKEKITTNPMSTALDVKKEKACRAVAVSTVKEYTAKKFNGDYNINVKVDGSDLDVNLYVDHKHRPKFYFDPKKNEIETIDYIVEVDGTINIGDKSLKVGKNYAFTKDNKIIHYDNVGKRLAKSFNDKLLLEFAKTVDTRNVSHGEEIQHVGDGDGILLGDNMLVDLHIMKNEGLRDKHFKGKKMDSVLTILCYDGQNDHLKEKYVITKQYIKSKDGSVSPVVIANLQK
jgi:hypothetical protein